jgi:hypothetical protein
VTLLNYYQEQSIDQQKKEAAMISTQISEATAKLESLSAQIQEFHAKNTQYKSEIDKYQSQKKNSINKDEFNKICQDFDSKLNTQNALLNSYKAQLSQTSYSSVAEGYKISHIGPTNINGTKLNTTILDGANASSQLTNIRKAEASRNRIIYLMVFS